MGRGEHLQLVEGERLRAEKVDLESPYSRWPGVEEVELLQGRDFDVCILGISLGALPAITKLLWSTQSLTHDPRWARMLEDVAVIQTISMQLWFDKSELYEVKPDIDGNPGTGRGLLTGYTAGGRDGEQAFAQSLPSQPWIAPRAELG